ncbi:putative C2H2 finger domain protein (Ezf) [Aspergillus lucknowensis]|uniref:C2H2-type domain-containing protein n=1 Tax=Aspergillus lucknowensis TaxID=176173 RepID=A0ABR4M0V8_9EURO
MSYYPGTFPSPSSHQPSSSSDSTSQTDLVYSSIPRTTSTFPLQPVDAGLGISYGELDPHAGDMSHYPPSGNGTVDWLGRMMPTSLPFGCSLNTTHLSPATFQDPYSGSDASASPLSFCGPQTLSASPSRGSALDYGRDHRAVNTTAYNFWPSTPHSETDPKVKQDPDADYRDGTYPGYARPASGPTLAPVGEIGANTLLVKAERFEENSAEDRGVVKLEVGRHVSDEPSVFSVGASPRLAEENVAFPDFEDLKIPSASGLECTVCGARFTRRSNCREHMKKHDPSRRKLYRCEDCGKTFGRKTDLKRHVDSVHRGIRRFGCEKCGYRFTRQDTLARHLAVGCKKERRRYSNERRKVGQGHPHGGRGVVPGDGRNHVLKE